MTLERSHDKLRGGVSARQSDNGNHADGANAPDRERDHHRDGRFKNGNRAAKGTGAKRAIRNVVPKRARRIFDDLCRQLGATGGTLAALHAADAVSHQLDSLDLGALARVSGLGTAEGERLHARAQRSSELAIRSATAALDAARLFKRSGMAARSAKVTELRARVDRAIEQTPATEATDG